MLRFLGRFQACFSHKNERLKLIRVGGYAPIFPVQFNNDKKKAK